MSLKGKDIISTRDFSADDLESIVRTAEDMKRDFISGDRRYKDVLDGVKAFLAFTENSTRTFYSSKTAAANLGSADIDGFGSAAGTSLKKHESWHDTIRMLAGYGSGLIVMRHHLDGSARWAQEVSKKAHADMVEKTMGINRYSVIPSYKVSRALIVNGGDGKNQHPTQFLLDYFTIRETMGDWETLDIGCFNDLRYGRTVHSIMVAAARGLLGNVKFHFAFPEGFGPSKHYLAELENAGIDYKIYDSLEDGLPNCDIGYLTRFQRERFRDSREEERIGKKWSLTAAKLAGLTLRDHLKLLHPLPIDKVIGEIKPCVHDSKHAYYFQQAANGVFVRMALFALITGKINDYRPSTGTEQNSSQFERYAVLPKGGITIEEKNRRSGYIEGDGLVIDHIPEYKGERLTGFLGWRAKRLGLVYTESVVGNKTDSVPKDVIKLHSGYEPSDDDYARIAVVAPDAVITIVRNGQKVEKRKPNLPSVVEGYIKCSNEGANADSGCISVNPKHKEGVPSRFVIENDAPLEARCHWCETTTDLETIYEEKRLIYKEEDY